MWQNQGQTNPTSSNIWKMPWKMPCEEATRFQHGTILLDKNCWNRLPTMFKQYTSYKNPTNQIQYNVQYNVSMWTVGEKLFRETLCGSKNSCDCSLERPVLVCLSSLVSTCVDVSLGNHLSEIRKLRCI